MDSTTAAIELTDLAKTFRTPGGERVRAVDGIDLTVRTGEVVAFLGPNGAGKTTALDLVLGLTRPTGRCCIEPSCEAGTADLPVGCLATSPKRRHQAVEDDTKGR
jgi:ABC-type Na+ transport system ATPase subunit NatA